MSYAQMAEELRRGTPFAFATVYKVAVASGDLALLEDAAVYFEQFITR